jgi:hypothetical protein
MNMEVSIRRSTATGLADATRESSVAPAPAERAAPQSPQNLLSGGFSLLHAEHCHGNGDPQSPQNFLPLTTLVPQRGQIIRPSSVGRSASLLDPYAQLTNMRTSNTIMVSKSLVRSPSSAKVSPYYKACHTACRNASKNEAKPMSSTLGIAREVKAIGVGLKKITKHLAIRKKKKKAKRGKKRL